MDERMSRLMDGELDDAAADAAFRELHHPDGIATWVCYHVIGDTLRRYGAPTPGFAERFAARLAAEPTVLALRAAQTRMSGLRRVPASRRQPQRPRCGRPQRS